MHRLLFAAPRATLTYGPARPALPRAPAYASWHRRIRGRDDMVSLGSLLAGSEPALSPGAEAVVSVGVATLWASPDRVRPVDEPALWVPSRPRDWVEGMSDEDRADLRGRILTQLLLGEHVIVRELRGDWAHVVALAQ